MLLGWCVIGGLARAADPPGPEKSDGGASSYRIESNTPERLVVVITEHYALGDNDSRLDARRLALESAKRRASELAGTYIETETRVTGNQISKDEIRTLSAAYMETSLLGERFELDTTGKQQLVLTVHADLDKTVIRKRIESLLQNAEYRGQIEQLQIENNRLREDLAGLNGRIVRKQGPDRYQVLHDRGAVLDKLDVTTASVRKVFEEGTLYRMAKKSQTQFDAAKLDLDENVLRYLQRHTQVTVGPPEMKPNPDGTADIHVRVSWAVDEKPLLDTLNRYFVLEAILQYDKTPNILTGIRIKVRDNDTGKGKVTFSRELLDYLKSHTVLAEIRAGDNTKTRPMAAAVSCFMGCVYTKGKADQWDDFFIRLQYAGDGFTVGSDSPNNETGNPVILSHVQESRLKTITSINARVLIR